MRPTQNWQQSAKKLTSGFIVFGYFYAEFEILRPGVCEVMKHVVIVLLISCILPRTRLNVFTESEADFYTHYAIQRKQRKI